MTFGALNLLFPIVLAVHNLDEVSRYEDFVGTYHARLGWKLSKLSKRRVVLDAAILMTLAVAVLTLMTYVSNSALLIALSEIAIFALMLNGIGHCLLSLRRRRMVPGTVSAVALVLPYSMFAVVLMRRIPGTSIWSLVRFAALGALTLPLAIVSFLGLSYGLSALTAPPDE